MGKGDKRSRKGKINAGSYGNIRMNPRKLKKKIAAKIAAKKAEKQQSAE